MKAPVRSYQPDRDYDAVGRLLVETYAPDPCRGVTPNWLQPRWEYMHYHPLVRDLDLSRIGIWEAGGRIVGVIHPEHRMGKAFFEVATGSGDAVTDSRTPEGAPTEGTPPGGAPSEGTPPEGTSSEGLAGGTIPTADAAGPIPGGGHATARLDLLGAMLSHAEGHLAAQNGTARSLEIQIGDTDTGFESLAAARGYRQTGPGEPMCRLSLSSLPPLSSASPVPEGFHLKSLAETDDLWKVHCVLWKGFGHGDDPAQDGVETALEERRFMQSAPGFRRELNIVSVTPEGELGSYAGVWYEPVHRIAYVEPVCTDPAYRRLGLARAALWEGLRRCRDLGARWAYVGSTLPLYLSMGFEEIYRTRIWRRDWA